MEPPTVERLLCDDHRQPHHPKDACRDIVPPVLRECDKGYP